MESSWFSQRNKTLCLQTLRHSKRAFEPAEAMLIKTKMLHVICIKTEGISKNSENSEGFLPENGGICTNPKILCLNLSSCIWTLYKRLILQAKSALWRLTVRCLAVLIIITCALIYYSHSSPIKFHN